MIFEHILAVAFVILLLLPGIVGVVLPALPGIPYMFLVVLGYAVIGKFQVITGNELLVLGGIAIASIGVDYLTGVLGARFAGASLKSLFIGLVGLLIGLLLVPPIGGLVGLFIGIFLGELFRHRDQSRALRAAAGGLLGSLTGIVINLLLALLFIILFLLFVGSR